MKPASPKPPNFSHLDLNTALRFAALTTLSLLIISLGPLKPPTALLTPRHQIAYLPPKPANTHTAFTPSPPTRQYPEDTFQTRFIIPLDLWERMVHVSSSLRELTRLASTANYTLVEPFVYESKSSLSFSFPEHFTRQNLIPQPASHYYDTTKLIATGHWASHADFRKHARLLAPDATLNKPQYIITAAVFFLWDNERFPNTSIDWSEQNAARRFFWCDQLLSAYDYSRVQHGFALTKNNTVIVQRAVCVSPRLSRPPASINGTYFNDLFAFVQQGTVRLSAACEQCLSLAFMNYRKGVFYSVAHPRSSKGISVLHPSKAAQEIAGRIRESVFKGRRYVALQMRTGKIYDVLNKHEKRIKASGGTVEKRHFNFRIWLQTATKRLVQAAKRASEELGGADIYVASDIHNDGWKGGEVCWGEACVALEEARKTLKEQLPGMYSLVPGDFGVVQDIMGMAGAVDAAACFLADRFVYVTPSNLGSWVERQRQYVGRGAETLQLNGLEEVPEEILKIWEQRHLR